MKKIIQISMLLIFFGVSLAQAQDVKYEVHEPKGNSMELVPFHHKLYNFEINIKYPEKWYATEEYGPRVNPSFYLTKEPIRGIGDRYTVGVALSYLQGFFVQQVPRDTDLGKMAKAVLSVRKWETVKKALVEGVESRGLKIISQEDLDVSGRPALKVESYSNIVRIRTYYVKTGIHLLVITCEAPPQNFEEYDGVFDSMMKTFSFTKEFRPIEEAEFLERITKKVISEK